MPDADRPQIPMPRDWNEAFAALPMESPGNDGWQRLTRALDGAASHAADVSSTRSNAHPTTRRRARWPMWLAAAAAVSAVALVPVLRREAAPVLADPPRVANIVAPSPSQSKSQLAPSTTTAPASATTGVATASQRTPETAVASAQPIERTAARRKPVGTPTRKPAPVASPLPSRRDGGTRIADATGTDTVAPGAGAANSTTGDRSATALADTAVAIQSLQAESAQLEALLALARDERVASASGAALSVELDERIGRIDASLSQPGLADNERADLWQQRVAAMRELTGIETTQRWLVTRGERYDGSLVSVD